MSIPQLLKKKSSRWIIIVVLCIALYYLILPMTGFYTNLALPFFDSIYKTYLLVPESIASQIFRILEAPIEIVNHELIFNECTIYHEAYETFFIGWPGELLYKKWCFLILGLIWISSSSIRRKIISSLCFLLAHIIAVTLGLILAGVAFPRIFQDHISINLSPALMGSLLLYAFLAIWTILNRENLQNRAVSLGIHIQINNRKLNEFLIILLFLVLINKFLIPGFEFNAYVTLLLDITNYFSSWFGQTGFITGNRLVGEYGTLLLGKPCLGIISLFLFCSFVYLTRDNLPKKTTMLYILAGLIFLNIVNIIRLVAIFIIVQGENGGQRAALHHEIYNMLIYIFIFALWILWYERFVRRATKKT